MDAELAWAAGFFDGEGWAGFTILNKIVKHPSGTFRMKVSQVRPEPLQRFCHAVGFGKVTGPYTQKQPNRKPYFQWRAHGSEAAVVASWLYPYLSEPKREQIDLSLTKFSEHALKVSQDKHGTR